MHPPKYAEAREKYEGWINELLGNLLKETNTIAPMVHVCIVGDDKIPGTKDLESFIKHKKEVIGNQEVRFEQLSKNHFVAACKKVRK